MNRVKSRKAKEYHSKRLNLPMAEAFRQESLPGVECHSGRLNETSFRVGRTEV